VLKLVQINTSDLNYYLSHVRITDYQRHKEMTVQNFNYLLKYSINIELSYYEKNLDVLYDTSECYFQVFEVN
jgi:hypothetical protein